MPIAHTEYFRVTVVDTREEQCFSSLYFAHEFCEKVRRTFDDKKMPIFITHVVERRKSYPVST